MGSDSQIFSLIIIYKHRTPGKKVKFGNPFSINDNETNGTRKVRPYKMPDT